jgi:hypothetical protein
MKAGRMSLRGPRHRYLLLYTLTGQSNPEITTARSLGCFGLQMFTLIHPVIINLAMTTSYTHRKIWILIKFQIVTNEIYSHL